MSSLAFHVDVRPRCRCWVQPRHAAHPRCFRAGHGRGPDRGLRQSHVDAAGQWGPQNCVRCVLASCVSLCAVCLADWQCGSVVLALVGARTDAKTLLSWLRAPSTCAHPWGCVPAGAVGKGVGTEVDGDSITYYATLQNTTGTFSVTADIHRVDCDPSCDPQLISAWVGDGPVSAGAAARCRVFGAVCGRWCAWAQSPCNRCCGPSCSHAARALALARGASSTTSSPSPGALDWS